jgi:hypothetical protein
MPEARWLLIEARVQSADPSASFVERLCSTAVDVLEARCVSLARVRHHLYSPIFSSDPLSTLLDEQQFAFADGPTFEAHKREVPIFETQLSTRSAVRKWPLFSKLARSHGILAAFAFPVVFESRIVGTLTIYRRQGGAMTQVEYGDARIFASMAAEPLAALSAVETSRLTADESMQTAADQSMLQLAAKNVADDTSCPTIAALVKIRAHAFAVGLPVSEVARQITTGELILRR